MGYEVATAKAWGELVNLNIPKELSVKFLADEYAFDLEKRQVISVSCNVPAKDFTAILILHYLAASLKGLADLSGEWENFRELAGIEGYSEAFRRRAIEPLLRKYGKSVQGLFNTIDRFGAKKVNQGDAAVVIEVFFGVPVLVELWAGDDEFAPEANILFDKSITKIFCTEDIIVLAGLVATNI